MHISKWRYNFDKKNNEKNMKLIDKKKNMRKKKEWFKMDEKSKYDLYYKLFKIINHWFIYDPLTSLNSRVNWQGEQQQNAHVSPRHDPIYWFYFGFDISIKIYYIGKRSKICKLF